MSSAGDLLRFDEYQERCLYDPASGFFASGGRAGGRHGDFLTSPEVGPLFGATIARGLDRWWCELGEPDRFDVVEVGAGRGALANAVLTASPACASAMAYTVVERSAPLRREAADRLGDRVTVTDALPGRIESGVVLANELLDNIPVRLVERTHDGWGEVLVGPDGPVLAPTELVRDWEVDVGVRLPVLTAAADWIGEVLHRLGAGRLVCIDYGVRRTVELADRPFLRTYLGHERGFDPFVDPGMRDITCDVAFDQLPTPDRISTQAEFLADLGIDELVDEGRSVWVERASIGDLEAIRGRSRVTESAALTDPTGLGAFLVAEWLAQAPSGATRDHNVA